MYILENGPRNVTVLCVATDVITTPSVAYTGSPAIQYFSIMAVDYDVGTGPVSVAFDQTVDVTPLTLTGRDHKCFKEFGGIPDPPLPGRTGTITVTGTGPFTVILTLKKHY